MDVVFSSQVKSKTYCIRAPQSLKKWWPPVLVPGVHVREQEFAKCARSQEGVTLVDAAKGHELIQLNPNSSNP